MSYFILSSLWGAVVGPHFAINDNFFGLFKAAAVICAIAGYVFHLFFRGLETTKNVCWIIAGLLWGTIHSAPEYHIPRSTAYVVWSSGCRSSDNELLVAYGGGIFSASGYVEVGDEVQLGPKIFGKPSSAVVLTSESQLRSSVCDFGINLRTIFYENIARYPADVAGWMRGFVLGEKAALVPSVVQTFRDVGLLHILVLSGGHLVVVSSFILTMMRLPILPLYVWRKISMNIWVRYWILSQCVMLIALGLFCLVVGFSQSVQRAFIVAALMNLSGVIGINLSPRRKVLAVLMLQIALFPVHMLSISMLLSWSGSLILIAFSESNYLMSWWERLRLLILVQLVFFVSSLIFFGHAGILSPVANLLGHVVFGMLLPLNILGIFFQVDTVDAWLCLLNRQVLRGVEFIFLLQQSMPTPIVYMPKYLTINALFGRALMVGLFVLLFWLTKFKRLSRRASPKDLSVI